MIVDRTKRWEVRLWSDLNGFYIKLDGSYAGRADFIANKFIEVGDKEEWFSGGHWQYLPPTSLPACKHFAPFTSFGGLPKEADEMPGIIEFDLSDELQNAISTRCNTSIAKKSLLELSAEDQVAVGHFQNMSEESNSLDSDGQTVLFEVKTQVTSAVHHFDEDLDTLFIPETIQLSVNENSQSSVFVKTEPMDGAEARSGEGANADHNTPSINARSVVASPEICNATSNEEFPEVTSDEVREETQLLMLSKYVSKMRGYHLVCISAAHVPTNNATQSIFETAARRFDGSAAVMKDDKGSYIFFSGPQDRAATNVQKFLARWEGIKMEGTEYILRFHHFAPLYDPVVNNSEVATASSAHPADLSVVDGSDETFRVDNGKISRAILHEQELLKDDLVQEQRGQDEEVSTGLDFAGSNDLNNSSDQNTLPNSIPLLSYAKISERGNFGRDQAGAAVENMGESILTSGIADQTANASQPHGNQLLVPLNPAPTSTRRAPAQYLRHDQRLHVLIIPTSCAPWTEDRENALKREAAVFHQNLKATSDVKEYTLLFSNLPDENDQINQGYRDAMAFMSYWNGQAMSSSQPTW